MSANTQKLWVGVQESHFSYVYTKNLWVGVRALHFSSANIKELCVEVRAPHERRDVICAAEGSPHQHTRSLLLRFPFSRPLSVFSSPRGPSDIQTDFPEQRNPRTCFPLAAAAALLSFPRIFIGLPPHRPSQPSLPYLCYPFLSLYTFYSLTLITFPLSSFLPPFLTSDSLPDTSLSCVGFSFHHLPFTSFSWIAAPLFSLLGARRKGNTAP